MSDLLKKIYSLNPEQDLLVAQPLGPMQAAKKEDKDEGGEGAPGSITLSVEQISAYLLACFTKERRQGEKKWGPVPFTEDPNSLLGQKRSRSSGCGELPSRHPFLANSQQFSGDDPKLTANPEQNEKAKERYPELRNENQLRKNRSFGQSRSKTVTLSR